MEMPELSVQESLSFTGGEVVWTVRLVLSLFITVHITTTVCPPAGYIHTGIAPLLTIECGHQANVIFGSLSSQSRSYSPSLEERVAWTVRLGFKFIHDGAYNHNCLPYSWVYTRLLHAHWRRLGCQAELMWCVYTRRAGPPTQVYSWAKWHNPVVCCLGSLVSSLL